MITNDSIRKSVKQLETEKKKKIPSDETFYFKNSPSHNHLDKFMINVGDADDASPFSESQNSDGDYTLGDIK